MDGILNYDLPQGPTTKAATRAANVTLLQVKRQERAEATAKAQLVEQIKRTEEQIANEREAKRRLAVQARDLRMQMERLATIAADMEKEKERRANFVETQMSHSEKRRAPLTRHPNEGMLTFQRIGCAKYPPEPNRKGAPSSRRTGFVTDYQGRMYLGGGERKSETQMHKEAMKEVERRRSETKRVANEMGGAEGTSPGLPDIHSGSLSGSSTKLSSNKQSKSMVYGKPSFLDLEKCKHLSSKRSRYYTDYEGRRIAMDPSDWPRTDGLLLL